MGGKQIIPIWSIRDEIKEIDEVPITGSPCRSRTVLTNTHNKYFNLQVAMELHSITSRRQKYLFKIVNSFFTITVTLR